MHVRKIFEACSIGVGSPFSFSKVAVNPLPVRFLGRAHADVEIIGVGRHPKIIHLGPFVEGVVVALGAFEPRTEEHANGVRHVVEGHSRIPKVVGRRRVFKNQTMTAYQFAYEFVVGSVDPYLFLDPFPVVKGVVYSGGDTQKVCPKLVMVGGVTGVVGQQFAYKQRVFVRGS